jgi:hypothetical protein
MNDSACSHQLTLKFRMLLRENSGSMAGIPANGMGAVTIDRLVNGHGFCFPGEAVD